MTRSMARSALLLAILLVPVRLAAEEPASEPSPAASTTDPYIIDQTPPAPSAQVPAPEGQSLRFLHANRAFLLTRLSANAGPGLPDPRLKSWLDEQMLAAMQTLGAAESALPHGGLTATADWPELEALSATLDSLAARTIGVDGRLRSLREDFAHHQATELLIAVAAPAELASGLEAIHLSWNGHEVAGVTLAAEDRAALMAGGYRPLHRAFARPEAQTIEAEIQLSGGRTLRGQAKLSPEANKLTVIVLDAQSAGIEARVWTL